ncbi:peptidase inhibitor family I36 protein [Streptomyces sp. NPDC005808]|uniref:peptidase inhibitor family I36 protein n=1 Tax=Streptomyces sp. NPDC005808 TaxID=3364734 RepID=UPI0036CEF4D8
MRSGTRQHLRQLAVTGVALAALGTAGIATAGSASAATGKNGVVEVGEFGLYYVTGSSGTVFDLFVSDTNFSGDVFPGTSISANDNTESYRNRDSLTWYVYTNAGAGGSEGWLDPGYVGNASTTFKNKISSAYYYDAN